MLRPWAQDQPACRHFNSWQALQLTGQPWSNPSAACGPGGQAGAFLTPFQLFYQPRSGPLLPLHTHSPSSLVPEIPAPVRPYRPAFSESSLQGCGGTRGSPYPGPMLLHSPHPTPGYQPHSYFTTSPWPAVPSPILVFLGLRYASLPFRPAMSQLCGLGNSSNVLEPQFPYSHKD